MTKVLKTRPYENEGRGHERPQPRWQAKPHVAAGSSNRLETLVPAAAGAEKQVNCPWNAMPDPESIAWLQP
jgi:hypothetical protein